jgi:uncharacterized membrane protein YfcA
MLPVAFFFVAVIYSAVGFGGGSTYIALLALSGQPAELIPLVALPCNILVVSLGSYFAVNRRDFDWRMAIPFLVSSVPMAFLGGITPIDERFYFLVLGSSLALAGASLCIRRAPDESIVGARSWRLAGDYWRGPWAALWNGWDWWRNFPRSHPASPEMGIE